TRTSTSPKRSWHPSERRPFGGRTGASGGCCSTRARPVDFAERMFDTRVLGIDPGVARLGLAVVARRGRAVRLIWTDVARSPAGMDESRRLVILVEAVRVAMDAHQPDAV